MADSTLAPGDRPANISRRQLLSTTTAASVALSAPGFASRHDRGAWIVAVAAFQCASCNAEACYRAHLRCVRKLAPEIIALEDRQNDLDAIRYECLATMIATPAPDQSAFLAKFETSYREHFLYDRDDRRVAAHLLADARRIA